MVPLPMIVLDKLCDRTAKVALPDRNDPIEAFVFDRADEALRVRIRVGRSFGCHHSADAAGLPEEMANVPAPLPINQGRNLYHEEKRDLHKASIELWP